MASARVQQTLERLQEDETLLGDLSDTAAADLMRWIEQQVTAADAGDDVVFEQRVAQIRAAAKAAARSEDAADGSAVARAEAILRGEALPAVEPPAALSADPLPPVRDVRQSPAAALLRAAPAPSTPAPQTASTSASEASPPQKDQEQPAMIDAAPRSIWFNMRRRIRRWTHRKDRS